MDGEQLRELVSELAEHWDDPYWWADHALLQTVLLCTAAGMLGLCFKYVELKMVQRIGGQPSV